MNSKIGFNNECQGKCESSHKTRVKIVSQLSEEGIKRGKKGGIRRDGIFIIDSLNSAIKRQPLRCCYQTTINWKREQQQRSSKKKLPNNPQTECKYLRWTSGIFCVSRLCALCQKAEKMKWYEKFLSSFRSPRRCQLSQQCCADIKKSLFCRFYCFCSSLFFFGACFPFSGQHIAGCEMILLLADMRGHHDDGGIKIPLLCCLELLIKINFKLFQRFSEIIFQRKCSERDDRIFMLKLLVHSLVNGI